jgi:hypothetical protein
MHFHWVGAFAAEVESPIDRKWRQKIKVLANWLDCYQSALRLASWLTWFATYTTAVAGAISLKSG